MNQLWFRPLVWIDYRLAVLFTVIIPAILLIWSLFAKIESLQKLLIIYWRVASLLLITVYLMIASWPIGFVRNFYLTFSLLCYVRGIAKFSLLSSLAGSTLAVSRDFSFRSYR